MAVGFLGFVFVKGFERQTVGEGRKFYGTTMQLEERKRQNTIVPSLVFSIQNRKKLNEKSRIILKTSHDIKSVRSITSLELGKKSFLKCMFREWFFNAIKMEKNLGAG